MNNKNGFTLIELLAVLAIMAIFALFVVPNVIKIYNENFENVMQVNEKNIADGAELYVRDNCMYPLDSSRHCTNTLSSNYTTVDRLKYYSGKITLEELRNADFITEASVKAKKTVSCTGCVIVSGDSTSGEMTFKTYMSCGENGEVYETDGYFVCGN